MACREFASPLRSQVFAPDPWDLMAYVWFAAYVVDPYQSHTWPWNHVWWGRTLLLIPTISTVIDIASDRGGHEHRSERLERATSVREPCETPSGWRGDSCDGPDRGAQLHSGRQSSRERSRSCWRLALVVAPTLVLRGQLRAYPRRRHRMSGWGFSSGQQ